jgi:hypothetical protein
VPGGAAGAMLILPPRAVGGPPITIAEPPTRGAGRCGPLAPAGAILMDEPRAVCAPRAVGGPLDDDDAPAPSAPATGGRGVIVGDELGLAEVEAAVGDLLTFVAALLGTSAGPRGVNTGKRTAAIG